MSTKSSVAKIVLVFSLLLLMTGTSRSAQAQFSSPESNTDPTACNSLINCQGAQDNSLTDAVLQVAATPGMTYQSFSGILFYPYESSVNYYFSYGTQTAAIVSPSWSGELVMPLTLPEGVDVKELTFYFRDNNNENDPLMGLCVAPISTNATSCTLLDTSSYDTGNIVYATMNGTTIATIDNANNSYFLVAYLAVADPYYGLVSARIGYQRSVFLPTVQKN